MKLITNEGVLPVSAPNPTWEEKFGYLIYPPLVTRSDDLAQRAAGVVSTGAMLTTPPDGSATWANAVTGGSLTLDIDADDEADDGGAIGLHYLRATGTAGSGIVTDVGTPDHQAMIRARAVGTSTATRGVGIILRWQDTSNYLYAVVRPDQNTITLQQRVNGTVTVPASTSFPFAVGTDYLILVKAKGNVITVRARAANGDTTTVLTFTTAQFNTATKAGIYVLAPAGLEFRVTEFYAGGAGA